MTDAELREQAKNKIKEREGFRNYLFGWAGVTVLCVIIWAITSPGQYFWPIWPFLGMGIGAASMWLGNKREARATSEEAITAEMNRIKNNK